ncbi:MAG: hypothetical protein MMC23_004644 [Stictis urceolatum]|nr:hypothetical protein [Stictis urceolata]
MTIIEEEGVPLLRMVPSTSSIGFDVDVTRSDNVVYTAFSHVWSDGLGNPEANEIFSCQWRRLQSFADCLKKGRHEDMGEEPMPFWLDIVCIPVCKDRNNTSNQCRRRRMRNKAIQGMRRIYCEADAVLILDNTMLSLESPFRAHEISLRLAYSKWMRRLWTLHEGAMARSAFIRLKNIHVSLHAFINWVEEAVDADTSKDSDKLLSSIGVTEATVPWRSCLHFNISWEAAGYHKMRFAWNEARSRGTKYEEDRYVVIASLLHIDHPEAMYELETPEEKIEFILTRVAEIPPLILFTVAPHIQKNGLRWAPATLNTRIGLVKESPPAIRTPEGLQVTFRGLYLHSQPNWNFRTRYRNQVSEIVQPSSKPEGQCTWIVKIDDGSHDGYLYSATFSIQDHETPKASKQQKLAIILQPRLDSAESLSPAVLVSCNGVKDGIEYTEYIAPIFWAKVTDPTKLLLLRHTIRKGDNQFILGSWRKDGEEPHQWCVG